MKKLFTMFVLAAFVQTALSQTSSVSLVTFSTGYTLPLGIENCGDSRLFIAQRTGQIIICDSTGNRLATPFLDISGRILSRSGEQGLLGLAFDPNYSSNGFLYVDYIDTAGNTQISRFKVSAKNANKANIATEKKMLQIEQPYTNHNGGCIRFGKDGFLYIATGDGGSAGDPLNNAQNPASLLGKILRINVRGTSPYTIPASNPFVDSAGYRKEIWALGMRNPWRFSFDALTGALLIADVGQESWEEVDLQHAKSKGGENYGWRCYEGNHPYNTSGCKDASAYMAPVYEYPHSDVTGDCSITGGFVYRGSDLPAFYGKYFFTDYCSGIIRTLTQKGGVFTAADVYSGDHNVYTSFGEDAHNELYLTNYVAGTILRIAASAAISANKPALLTVFPNPAHDHISVQYSTQKAQECMLAVFDANGRQVFSGTKTTVVGENTWNISLPPSIRGHCYVTVTDRAGNIIKKNVAVQ